MRLVVLVYIFLGRSVTVARRVRCHCKRIFLRRKTMKRKTQNIGMRLRQIYLRGQVVSGFGTSPPPSRLGSYRVFVLMIAVIVLLFSAIPLRGQSESEGWDILAVREKEYISDDVPLDIPGRGTKTSALTITDAGPITDLNVKLNITHPYDADLDVYLIAPDGTRVELFTDVGAMGENFVDTILDNEASQSITDGRAPFTGSFRPEGNLAELYGKDIEGKWSLEVTDDWSSSRAGTLNSWSLIISIEVTEPLLPPVIDAEASVPDGIFDTIVWDDIGGIRQYDSDVPEAIPDEGTVTSELVIDDVGAIEDLNVRVNISHSLDSDLDVFLIAPDGKTRIELFTDVGGSGDNFEDTILDDDASVSITEGSAPFAGSYRPEGSLAELIGRDIFGTWMLEITDDSWLSSGTLNSWSLIANLADVAYYGECATDLDFSDVIANSGWITKTSYTFTEVKQTKEYRYRVKARPVEAWLQTSQEHFERDILTDTQAVNGDITLLGSGGDSGPELHVITHPSFESLEGWGGGRSNPNIFVGGVRNFWASDGDWAGLVEYDYGSVYVENDLGLLAQAVNFTGVETFVFDYANFGFAEVLVAAVIIGDTVVWVENGANGLVAVDAHYDQRIDVSAFEGVQDLTLAVQTTVTGRYDAGIMWDNLRTYGPSGYAPSGQVVSVPVSIGDVDTWGILVFNTTIPKGTELTLDILPAEGSDPIPGYVDIPSGTDLSGLEERIIRLRANLSTSDSAVSPILHDWSISYTDAIRESEWSNVVSSSPKTK